MLIIGILLTLVCTAFGVPEFCLLPNMSDNMKNSCPGKCLNQEHYRQTFAALAPKCKVMVQKFKSTGQLLVLPPVEAEQMEKACMEINTIEECVRKCCDDELRKKFMVILIAAADLACDPEIKANAPCLSTLESSPQTCVHKCSPCVLPFMDSYYQTSSASQATDWKNAQNLAIAFCKLITCGLKCTKEAITLKCQVAGYNAMKTMLKKIANLAQVAQAQFSQPERFPTECKPDSIVTDRSQNICDNQHVKWNSSSITPIAITLDSQTSITNNQSSTSLAHNNWKYAFIGTAVALMLTVVVILTFIVRKITHGRNSSRTVALPPAPCFNLLPVNNDGNHISVGNIHYSRDSNDYEQPLHVVIS